MQAQPNQSARQTFAARFGEDQAAAIEAAARKHYDDNASITRIFAVKNPHGSDNLGSDPFRYWFLLAIGYECVTNERYRQDHGITADVDEMKEWALGEGRLGEHDGDIPDYVSLLAGLYDGWIRTGGGER